MASAAVYEYTMTAVFCAGFRSNEYGVKPSDVSSRRAALTASAASCHIRLTQAPAHSSAPARRGEIDS
jgi:hypothetical protein